MAWLTFLLSVSMRVLSIGSQVMHMLTVMIVGLAMGQQSALDGLWAAETVDERLPVS